MPVDAVRSNARGRAVGWIVPVALGVISLGYLVGFLVGGGTGELLTSLAFAATAVPFLLAAIDSPCRLLHPLSVLGFTMVLGVAGETALLTYLDRKGDAVEIASPFRLLSGLGVEALGSGVLVVCAGLAALVFGYCLPASGRAHPAGALLRQGLKHGLDRPSPDRTVWVIVLLSLFAAVCFRDKRDQMTVLTPGTSKRKHAATRSGWNGGRPRRC